MGMDCDDAGALAVLHALADRGEAEILCVTHCTSAAWGVPCIEAINRYYGRPGIPIGTWRARRFLDEEQDLSYTRAVAGAYPVTLGSSDLAPDAVPVMRAALAARVRPDAIVIGIGPAVNLAALLASGPDVHSPLTGRQLAAAAVARLVLMGGRFPSGIEWNFRQDPAAARSVLERWPTPVLLSGSEIGDTVRTGSRLYDETPPWNPVRTAYHVHTGRRDNASFDQTAVLAAVRGPRCCWRLSPRGRVTVEPSGESRWAPRRGGPHRHLLPRRTVLRVAAIVEDLMVKAPSLGAATGPEIDNEALFGARRAAIHDLLAAITDPWLEELPPADGNP